MKGWSNEEEVRSGRWQAEQVASGLVSISMPVSLAIRLARSGGMCDGGGEWECGSDGEESDCILVLASILTSVSGSNLDPKTPVPQNFSLEKAQ